MKTNNFSLSVKYYLAKWALYAVIFISLNGCYSKEPSKTGLEGKPLPSFNLLTVANNTYINTNNIPKGKPIVFFYFAPWCPYSRAQMQEIVDKIDKLNTIQLYLISTSPVSEIKKFGNDYKISKFPNIVMAFDYTDFFADHFKAPGVPFIAIFGKGKLLNQAFVGKTTVSEILEFAQR